MSPRPTQKRQRTKKRVWPKVVLGTFVAGTVAIAGTVLHYKHEDEKSLIAIPGAERYQLAELRVYDDEAQHPYLYSSAKMNEPLEARDLREEWEWDEDRGDLHVNGSLTVYPEPADAEKAAQLWLMEQEGTPVTLADGSAAKFHAERPHVVTARADDGILVTVEVQDWSYDKTTEEMQESLEEDAAAIRDLIAAADEEILAVEAETYS